MKLKYWRLWGKKQILIKDAVVKLKAVVSVEEGSGGPAFDCEPELASEMVSVTFWLGVAAPYQMLLISSRWAEKSS